MYTKYNLTCARIYPRLTVSITQNKNDNAGEGLESDTSGVNECGGGLEVGGTAGALLPRSRIDVDALAA